jgi:hypothetical protein
MATMHYVISSGTVCVSGNGKRIDAKDLYRRLVEKYGPDCAKSPANACFSVHLTKEQVHAVLTDKELKDRPLVAVPDERLEPGDWHDVPEWAKYYIQDLEEKLGLDVARDV